MINSNKRQLLAVAMMASAIMIQSNTKAATDKLRNQTVIPPETGMSVGQGWDTQRKNIVGNPCIELKEGSGRSIEDTLVTGDHTYAEDTGTSHRYVSNARGSEIVKRLGISFGSALNTLAGTAKISAGAGVGTFRDVKRTSHAVNVMAHWRMVDPYFIDTPKFRLSHPFDKYARGLNEEGESDPEGKIKFRERCGNSFVVGKIVGHKFFGRLSLNQKGQEALWGKNVKSSVNVKSVTTNASASLDMLKGNYSKLTEDSLELEFIRTDDPQPWESAARKIDPTQIPDGVDFDEYRGIQKVLFFEELVNRWPDHVSASAPEVTNFVIAPYEGFIDGYPTTEGGYLDERDADDYLAWFVDALWGLERAFEDAEFAASHTDAYALGATNETRAKYVGNLRIQADRWRAEFELLKPFAADCANSIESDELRRVSDHCKEVAEFYNFERKLELDVEKVLPIEKQNACRPFFPYYDFSVKQNEGLTLKSKNENGNKEAGSGLRMEAFLYARRQDSGNGVYSRLVHDLKVRIVETEGNQSRRDIWEDAENGFWAIDLQYLDTAEGMPNEVDYRECVIEDKGLTRGLVGEIREEVSKSKKAKEQVAGDFIEFDAQSSTSVLKSITCKVDASGKELVIPCDSIKIQPALLPIVNYLDSQAVPIAPLPDVKKVAEVNQSKTIGRIIHGRNIRTAPLVSGALSSQSNTPSDSIVGMGVSKDATYVWYANGTASKGRSNNLDYFNKPYAVSFPPGYSASDVVAMGVAAGSSNLSYAWYRNEKFSVGYSNNLNRNSPPSEYTLPARYSSSDIVAIAIAGSNDHVYAWYKDGYVSSGTASKLDEYRAPYEYTLPPGYSPSDIIDIGITKDDRVYTWFKDGKVSIGSADDLDSVKDPYPYSKP